MDRLSGRDAREPTEKKKLGDGGIDKELKRGGGVVVGGGLSSRSQCSGRSVGRGGGSGLPDADKQREHSETERVRASAPPPGRLKVQTASTAGSAAVRCGDG